MAARLTFLRDGAVHVSTAEAVAMHATPAYKLVVGVDADLHVRTARGDVRHRVVLVPPNVPQAMHSPGTVVAFFCEPGSAFAGHSPGPRGVELVRGRAARVLTRIASEGALRADGDAHLIDEAFRALSIQRARVDPRAEAAIKRVATEPDLDAATLARSLRLSPERLRFLVREQTGHALRTHRLWHRTIEGVERLFSGAAIARAAQDAGFSDHAHFTRAVVRFLGRPPSSMHGEARVLASYAARVGPARASSK